MNRPDRIFLCGLLVLVSLLVAPPAVSGDFVRGDADRSGSVNISDAVIQFLHIFGSDGVQFERLDEVTVGQAVLVIGNAMGIGQSVTRGIVSAKKKLDSYTLIQTDAAINPGNSGGPLLTIDGRVIGMNTLRLKGEVEGMGFAISADDLIDLISKHTAEK